jgi:hypothetical protein
MSRILYNVCWPYRDVSMSRRGGVGPFSAAILAIVAGILVYSVLGAYFSSSFVVIYDNISPQDDTLSNIIVSVQNKAPLSLPYIVPSYSLAVSVLSNTSDVRCSINTLKGELPCSATALDLGAIGPGQSHDAYFRIQTDQACCAESGIAMPGNFTLKITVYMNFFLTTPVQSRQIACANGRMGHYNCVET